MGLPDECRKRAVTQADACLERDGRRYVAVTPLRVGVLNYASRGAKGSHGDADAGAAVEDGRCTDAG